MWLWIVLSAILVALVHWILKTRYGYWESRGVPGPKPHVVIGNMGPSLIFKQNLGQIYADIYNAYKDCRYVGYYKFMKPGILLRDIDLVKDVLVKEFQSFHDNDIHIDENIDPLFGKNPFVLKGNKWKVIRSLITSGITSGKVKNMFYLMNNVANNMVKYLSNEQNIGSKDGLEAKELSAKFATDVVATCAFGLEAKSFENEDNEFRRMGRKVLNTSFFTAIKMVFLMIMPGLSNLLKIKFIPNEVEEWFKGILSETIKFRQKNNVTRHDYLDLLLSLKTKQLEYIFDDEQVYAQAMTFYADGFETSSIGLSFTLYELAANLDVQQKVRDEINATLMKHNGEFTYDAIQDMSYLNNCFLEGLRKHIPMPFIARICTQKYTLPPSRGYNSGPAVEIEPGTPILIPAYAIHHDPNIYPDPDRYDPERFNEDCKDSRPKCSFLSFGEGPRICLGQRFAFALTKLALAVVVKNFKVTVNPKTITPLEIDPQFFMKAAKGGIWLDFKKI